MDYGKLKIELADGHPVTGPYSDNAATAAAQGHVKNVSRAVASVTGQALFEATTPADLALLTSDQRQVYFALMGAGTVLINAKNTMAALFDMFPDGSDTRANLVMLQIEWVSQWDALGLGTVYEGNVLEARR
jgi:sugar (pentulose or hexulose) kinase